MNRLVEISGFKASEEKAVLLAYIRNCKDPEVLRYKKILTENVPYRLQAPFLDLRTNEWNVGKKQLIDRIAGEGGGLSCFIRDGGETPQGGSPDIPFVFKCI